MADFGVFVVRDDISKHGMRRLHLLAASAEGGDGLKAELERQVSEGEGMLEGRWEWEDDLLGNYHVYGIWRLGMNVSYPMYCVALDGRKLDRAIWGAVMGWRRRLEEAGYPNRVIAREGALDFERYVLTREDLDPLKAKGDEREVVLERVAAGRWFPGGVVGVYRVEEGMG